MIRKSLTRTYIPYIRRRIIRAFQLLNLFLCTRSRISVRKALIRKKLLVSSRFRETETRNKPFEQEREINRGKKKGEKGKGGNNKKKNRGDRRDERDSNH